MCVVSWGLAFALSDRGAAAGLRACVILGERVNGIGEAGAAALADALRTNTALTSLNLGLVALRLIILFVCLRVIYVCVAAFFAVFCFLAWLVSFGRAECVYCAWVAAWACAVVSRVVFSPHGSGAVSN